MTGDQRRDLLNPDCKGAALNLFDHVMMAYLEALAESRNLTEAMNRGPAHLFMQAGSRGFSSRIGIFSRGGRRTCQNVCRLFAEVLAFLF